LPQEQHKPEHVSEGSTANDILTRLRALQTPASQMERALSETTAELRLTISEIIRTSFSVPSVAQALAELAQNVSPLAETSAAFAKLERDLSNAQRAIQEAFQIASETAMNSAASSQQGKQELRALVDMLPDSEILAAAHYLEFLVSTKEAPVDPAMLERIDAARAESPAGIPHEEILREYGL
jgi:methyl-accepting chemotaxis protein